MASLGLLCGRLGVPAVRWVVERTFSWFGRNWRLAKDFENLAETLGAFVALASIQLALRWLAGRRSPSHQTAGLHCTAVKVCKSNCERTIAGTRGYGEVAPIVLKNPTAVFGMKQWFTINASHCNKQTQGHGK